MVVMAYLAGLCTPLAAFVGTWWGLAWWARLRRSEGHAAPELGMVVYPPTATPLPPPSSQEDRITIGRVAYGRNVPHRRGVRGRKPGR